MNNYFNQYEQIDLESVLKFVCLAAPKLSKQRFVFLFTNHQQAKSAKRRFSDLNNSIPEWARQKVVKDNNAQCQVWFKNGFSVHFMSNPNHLRGVSMNGFFFSETCSQDEIAAIIPCLTNCGIKTVK